MGKCYIEKEKSDKALTERGYGQDILWTKNEDCEA